MAVTMARIIPVTYKLFHVRLLTAALLISFAAKGVAQVGAQQMPGSSNGSSSSGATSRNGSGAAAMQSSGLTMVPVDFAKLSLAPGFLVGLEVLDDPDFTGSFRLDQQGDIAVPILGTIHVAGATVSQARVQIQQRLLENKILKDPQVKLTVLEYTSPEVTIIGEVASPGKYPLLVPRKLVDILALAGGTTLTAGNEVQITRGSANAESVLVHYSRATNSKAVEDVIVHPGDTVQVKRAGIVYVLGAVTRPGGFVMQEEGTLNVLQAIALAYGTTTLASTRSIYIMHRNADGSVVYTGVPYKKMTRGQSANIQLHATDVLFVPTSTIKTIYANTQTLLNQVGVASIYLAAGY
jgi:polysaccharide biosynthesis/export protein